MIALDTNVMLRLITDDDPQQADAARRLADGNDLWISALAMMESEWVLRSAYRWPVARIADALEALMLAPRVHVELADHIAWALSRFRGGADLADMLHLVAARDNEAFASFDHRLAQQAGPDCPVPVETLV